MTRPKGTGGKANELTPEEILRIDRCLGGTRHELRDRSLFFLGLGSGMRIGECVGLSIKDVIDEEGNILDQIILEKHSTKSKKSRTVFLSKQAHKHLKPYIDELLEKRNRNAPLFSGQKKPRHFMHPNYAVSLIQKIFSRAAVVNVSSHSLRRTHANTLRRNGADLMLIKEQLGHSSLAITQRYFNVDPLEAAQIVGKLKF